MQGSIACANNVKQGFVNGYLSLSERDGKSDQQTSHVLKGAKTQMKVKQRMNPVIVVV